MNLTLNFYPFRLTIIENSPLNKKSNSFLFYKGSQLFLILTTQEVKPTSCLQFSQHLSQEVKSTSCYNSLKNSTPKKSNPLLVTILSRFNSQEVKPTFCYKSRNYYNSIINLEQINKD